MRARALTAAVGLVAAGCTGSAGTTDDPAAGSNRPTATEVTTTEPAEAIAAPATTAPAVVELPPMTTAEPTAAPAPDNAVTAAVTPPAAPDASTAVTSAEVVGAFAAAGLEAESPTAMTREDYGLAPLVSDDATRFLIPALGEDAGGRVFIVSDSADREALATLYREMGRASAAFYSHVLVRDDLGALVQINGELPDEQAARYDTVLQGL